jgi:hypothetical protein
VPHSWHATRTRCRGFFGTRSGAEDGSPSGVGFGASVSYGKPYLAHNANIRLLFEALAMDTGRKVSKLKSHESSESTSRGPLLVISQSSKSTLYLEFSYLPYCSLNEGGEFSSSSSTMTDSIGGSKGSGVLDPDCQTEPPNFFHADLLNFLTTS